MGTETAIDRIANAMVKEILATWDSGEKMNFCAGDYRHIACVAMLEAEGCTDGDREEARRFLENIRTERDAREARLSAITEAAGGH